jgi:formylglycine-generating enzyme required for sulfatase activity
MTHSNSHPLRAYALRDYGSRCRIKAMGHPGAKAVQLRRMLHVDLMCLLCLVSPGFVDRRAIAQEVVGQEPTALTIEQERPQTARPGSDFKECANGCPMMIVIPSGKFIMGSPENEPGQNASEGPLHEVTTTKFEVTFEDWDACVAAAACPRVPDVWGRGGCLRST